MKVISLPYIFQVLYVLCFTRPRYQVSFTGPLVLWFLLPARMIGFSEDLTIALQWNYQRTRVYRGITVFEKLMVHNNPDIDLVGDNEYTKFG